MVVNLHTLCKVQLNQLGKAIWLSQIELLPEELKNTNPELIEAIKTAVDSEGCVQTELWSIMNIFGPYMSPQSMPFVTTTVELDRNPNFKKIS